MTFGAIFSGIVFGGIGFAAFIYGKKSSEWRPMTIGIALMVYTYFIPDVILQWVIGALLTASLFVFK